VNQSAAGSTGCSAGVGGTALTCKKLHIPYEDPATWRVKAAIKYALPSLPCERSFGQRLRENTLTETLPNLLARGRGHFSHLTMMDTAKHGPQYTAQGVRPDRSSRCGGGKTARGHYIHP